MTVVLIILLIIYCSYVILKRYKEIRRGKYCTGSCCGCSKNCEKE